MPRIAYVNGAYRHLADAAVHVEDRGYQFADGVYEVCAVLGGQLLDQDAHLDRLAYSLDCLAIRWPVARAAMAVILNRVVARNRLRDGLVYIQVSRGVAPRDHPFPGPATPPSLVVTARPLDFRAVVARQRAGIGVKTLADQRWARCDIKSIALLPNVVAKQAARAAGAYEAWLVDADGKITEGASTNAWIITQKGVLVSRHVGPQILRGITRTSLLGIADALDLRIEERPFSLAQARRAAEAFSTSSSNFLLPVTAIDGRAIGNGRPGPITAKLLRAYWREVARQTGVNYHRQG